MEVRNFKVIILLLSIFLGIFNLVSSQMSSFDGEFEKFFKLKHIVRGDNSSFPYRGSKVTVHYTGTFPNTGKKFDSSVDRGEPFTFNLGMGEVIRCWDQVVKRMSVGEKIQVVCPWQLAYGEKGIEGTIPEKADLAFEIELFYFK